MGGRGSWSSSGTTFEVNPSGGGDIRPEKVLGPRVPGSLSEALGETGKPMGMARAAEGTNPHYNRSYDAYSSNCQRCVLAYEARRRGYDVTALPTYSGDMLPYSGDYLKALSNPQQVNVGKSKQKIVQQMKQYGAGSRAIIRVSKANGSGHVFIAENVGGKITYVDPQTNSRYRDLNLSRVSNAAVVRIDNQQFTEYAKNAFTRQKV